MSSTVEKIKEKMDVVEVIGSYLKLEKAGNNFKAKCPFHNEKTPSFFVSPSRSSYYCFGCGAKGDIFSFVQEFEGTDFLGALKVLAEKAGVPLERENIKERGEKEKLYSVLEIATVFFERNLEKSDQAKKYLLDRGINLKSIKEWRIGFAFDEWRELFDFLTTKGFSEKEMLAVGLIKKNESSKEEKTSHYDVFRGRIIFPIFDASGKVIAFSGRIFPDKKDSPKYLNSPETSLFAKSEVLYGFDKAKSFIRSKDYSILVEGQFDLVMCHQAGFTNTVATSGTAFTTSHLDKLKRVSKNILLAFDSDSAGFGAANKSAVLALSLGMDVKLASLPKGSDPADLILSDSEKWSSALKQSKHIIDFYLDHLISELSDKRKIAKEVKSKILPYVAMLESSIDQSHFVSQISKKTSLREEAVWKDLSTTPRASPDSNLPEEEVSREKEVFARRKNFIERHLFAILFWQEGLEKPAIHPDQIRKSMNDLAGESYVKEIENSFSLNKEELVFEAEAYYGNKEKFVYEFEELLIHFEDEILKEKFSDAMLKLHQAEESGDEKEAELLLAMCQTISIQLAEISRKRTSKKEND